MVFVIRALIVVLGQRRGGVGICRVNAADSLRSNGGCDYVMVFVGI